MVIEYKGENNRILHEMMDGILLTTNAKGLSSSYEYGTESEPTRLKASYSLRAQSADGAVSPDGVLTIDLAQSIDPKPLLEAAIKAFQDITVKANHMGLMPAIIAYKQEHGIIASMKVVSTKGMVGGQPLATPVSPAIDTAAAKILADRELSKILPQTLKI